MKLFEVYKNYVLDFFGSTVSEFILHVLQLSWISPSGLFRFNINKEYFVYVAGLLGPP